MQKPSASDLVVLGLLFVGMSTVAYGEPQRNAQRVNREPGWSGPSVLQGDAKTANIDMPILERDYRPLQRKCEWRLDDGAIPHKLPHQVLKC